MKLLKTALIMSIVFLTAVAANAGITVNPDRHIVIIPVGESRTVEYQIYNSGPEGLSIDIDPQDWTGLIDVDIDSWLSLKDKNITIDADTTEPLRVKLTAPEEARGEMVGMLFLCYKETEGSSLNIRNGIPVYLVIEGTEEYSALIKDIDIDYSRTEYMDNLNMVVKVKNDGNIHINPDIVVYIKDSEGETIKELSSKAQKVILRNYDYDYKFTWRRPKLKKGNYRVVTELSYEDKLENVKSETSFTVGG